MHRGKRALVWSSLLFVAVAAAVGPARPDPADAGWKPRYRRWTTPIGPGLTLVAIKDTWGPVRMRVLEIDPSAPLTIDVALVRDRLGHRARTSQIARNHGAIAAINGDFPYPSGQPTHPMAMDGELVMTSRVFGQNFAVSHDEREVFAWHPAVRVDAVELDSGASWAIDRWHFWPPDPGEVAAFGPVGGAVQLPPGNACAARLYPQGDRTWAPDRMGVSRTYVVDRARCAEDPMPRWGGLVLATPMGTDPPGPPLDALLPGETVRITWSFGWPGVLDSLGGIPLLVKQGALVAPACGAYFCRRHPRTGVGFRADGTVLFVVVDGRDSDWSVGMTLVEFGEQFRRLGAVWAMNLDGGGSSTMWVDGRVVNRPSDGEERPVSTALLVLPGPDPDETTPLGWPEEPPPGEPPPIERAAWGAWGAAVAGLDVAFDPASTGGMLDALARGELGIDVPELPPEAREVLRVFRGAGRSDGTAPEGR